MIESDTLIEELVAEGHERWWDDRLSESAVGRQLLAADAEAQRLFVLAAVAWLDANGGIVHHTAARVRGAAFGLLRRRLPFTHDDIALLLDWAARQSNSRWQGAPQMSKIVEDYIKANPLTSDLRRVLQRLASVMASGYTTAESRRHIARLEELSGQAGRTMPLTAGEAWADAAAAEIEAADEARRAAWIELLTLCAKTTGSAPSAKWRKSVATALKTIGGEAFREAARRWFALVDRGCTRRVETWAQYQPDPNLMLDERNADVLRGLVWLCADEEDQELARSLLALAASAYRKVPGIGPRSARVGNACVWAMGRMPGTAGVEQLALLKLRVKTSSAQNLIASALHAAAERMGLASAEIEEMTAPAYGLQEVGARRDQVGGFTAEIVVGEMAELRWTRADGKRLTSTPKAIKESHAAELKELTQTIKDIRLMLPAQAARIENLYLEQKRWSLPVWRERYLDHPLVGTLARRLIWRFIEADRIESGMYHDGRITDAHGRELDFFGDAAQVELWHPLGEPIDSVLSWRELLSACETRQPFKQAYREVYLLTDAERATRVYSNRFAAHILKQHQFNALCAARGWQNKLRLMVDDEYPPAMRSVPVWNLRAEFWIEGAGENYETDATEAGTFLYLTTDQMRFYTTDARLNYAHAGGGGYGAGWHGRDAAPAAPQPLDAVPPLVFSEIMRDVDLFVSVASVANDPNWADGGPEGRYANYWASYSFGELSETAKTRRAVLERLVPRLKIADRCRLTDKFLIVRGDVRTYKIHLGSGNILMEPNDQYLCIVPARGVAAGERESGKVFLPFEGDGTLAVILSKAFLLADDRGITDSTILRQIRL